ncbi:MAG: hypothetical protein JKX97_06415 [Candidatus Lindowbacteria bacterium]|nr:hypothetical protein [Candidatus Lindowbacteria bacterium]
MTPEPEIRMSVPEPEIKEEPKPDPIQKKEVVSELNEPQKIKVLTMKRKPAPRAKPKYDSADKKELDEIEVEALVRAAVASVEAEEETPFEDHIRRGDDAFKAKRYVASLRYYEYAFLMDGNNPEVIEKLEAVKLVRKEFSNAQQLLEILKRMKPEDAKVYEKLGDCWFMLGNYYAAQVE